MGHQGPVAALIVLEHMIKENLHQLVHTLKIFSDSQCTVGLITLNYTAKHYIDVIRDIKDLIEELKIKGVSTSILWTPGHAGIVGNDEADILAKEAAEEARNLPPENNILTLQDIKKGAEKSTEAKWLRRWTISDRGRDLYEKMPSLNPRPLYDHPSKLMFSIFIQLRTGYSTLNNYRHKMGQTNITPLCECGQIESETHFLLECHLYEQERQEMLTKITKELGIRRLNMATLLTPLEGETYEETKYKLELVSSFIDSTRRFQTLNPHSQ